MSCLPPLPVATSSRPVGRAPAGRWLVGAALLLIASAPTALAQSRGAGAGTDDAPERTGARVALVFGNAAYTGVAPLQNSVNDARDIGAALGRLGFEVLLHADESREGMAEAVRTFAQRAAGADVALLFYAGHGAEVGGENFLLPVDVSSAPGDALRREAIALSEVLGAMRQAVMQVIVLDACRNNPFPDSDTGGGSGGWGLPPADALGGTLVAYGTAPNSVASDNVQGRNGRFTEALLAELETPGLEAAELMRRVTRRVREASRDAQSPWLSASYVLPFFFIEPQDDGRTRGRPTGSVSDVEQWARDGQAAYAREAYAEALPALRRAAQAGHTDSQYYLGTLYMAGRGVAVDADEAADWFRLASLRGHPKAQYFLGGMYSGGFESLRRDDGRAAELYLRAAEQGLAAAQFRLGVVYESGRGVREDRREALRWYTLAARQGHDDARAALQRLADDGDDDARSALRLL